jgi:hypothetical protein
MKKQRRGKFTYIPKDEIAEVTTFNDVTFENDDLLDGAYVKGRKKYARGGKIKLSSLEEQAAEAVGNDVWFSLPNIEKAELVEELVKSGMITPPSLPFNEVDMRILQYIEQNKDYQDDGSMAYMADGGEIEVGDFVKYKKAKYHATVLDVVDDVEIPYAKIEYPNGMIVTAYLEDLRKVILGVAPEYVNPNYMADGGYTNKFASMKGGIDYYSVDIDTEDGENVRDLEFKSYNKAKKVYDEYKKSMEYDGQSIEDIQLIVIYKNGDYDSIGRTTNGEKIIAPHWSKMSIMQRKEILEVVRVNPSDIDMYSRMDVSELPEYIKSKIFGYTNIRLMADGGTAKLARGGFNVGRWYRDSSGEEFKYVGEDMKGNPLFNDGARTLMKPYEDFDSVKESSAFSWFAKGGVATDGKFLVKYYLKEEPNEFKEKIFDDRDKAEFFFDTIQDDDDIVVMPIEIYREKRPVEMSTTVYDKVIAEKAAEKAADAGKKSLFAAAKPVPATKSAAKKRERVQVDGIANLIREYDELNAVIKDAESSKKVIGGELKELGREKFLDLYEQRGFRPANFDLADGNENILLEVTDKYLKVEPEKAAILEQYDGLLEVKTTYEFNEEILEKRVSDSMTVGDVVSMLIQDSNLLSDSDKENLIKAKTTMRVPKGTLDRLLDYDNPREVFSLIQPILALK